MKSNGRNTFVAVNIAGNTSFFVVVINRLDLPAACSSTFDKGVALSFFDPKVGSRAVFAES